jgi:hypothetical protein
MVQISIAAIEESRVADQSMKTMSTRKTHRLQQLCTKLEYNLERPSHQSNNSSRPAFNKHRNGQRSKCWSIGKGYSFDDRNNAGDRNHISRERRSTDREAGKSSISTEHQMSNSESTTRLGDQILASSCRSRLSFKRMHGEQKSQPL